MVQILPLVRHEWTYFFNLYIYFKNYLYIIENGLTGEKHTQVSEVCQASGKFISMNFLDLSVCGVVLYREFL